MVLNEEARRNERQRIAQLVLDLVKERGVQISYQAAFAESGLTRARFDQVFSDYDDLFDTVAQVWLAPQLNVMEEVLAQDLPSNRKMFEFIRRRFVIARQRYEEDPDYFANICEMGAANFERVRSYVDLADHYLCEIIAEAQADGYFSGLEIDEALSLINQIISCYSMPDALLVMSDRLSEEKLARIIDTMFAGLSADAGASASGVGAMRLAR